MGDAMPCDFYQAYEILNNFMADVQPIFVKNVDIAFVDVIAKVTVADITVIFMADVNAMMCMRCSYHTYLLILFCYEARWQMFLPLCCVVDGKTT